MPSSASRPPGAWQVGVALGPPILGRCHSSDRDRNVAPTQWPGRGQAGLWPDPCRSRGYRAANGNRPCCPRLLGGYWGLPQPFLMSDFMQKLGCSLPVSSPQFSVISVSGTGRMKKHDCETPKKRCHGPPLSPLWPQGRAGDWMEDKLIRELARSRDRVTPVTRGHTSGTSHTARVSLL